MVVQPLAEIENPMAAMEEGKPCGGGRYDGGCEGKWRWWRKITWRQMEVGEKSKQNFPEKTTKGAEK